MIQLNIIKYDNANCLEATWTEVTTEEYQSPIMELNEDGEQVDSGKTETKTRETKTQIKCHAYADVQMDMLRADSAELGTPLDEYEALIAEVEANIVPPPPPTSEELAALV